MTDALPPGQYDHEPTKFVVEHVLTSDEVNKICHANGATDWNGQKAAPSSRFWACSHVTSSGCEIWRIDDGIVRRHEIGHCNGWPANHPR
jgi:hypothetical protein